MEEFVFKTEFWIPIWTNKKARSISEFVDIIKIIDEGSIFYHFYVNIYNYHNLPTIYSNSFAYWFYQQGYQTLAEKISIIDATLYNDLNSIRHEVSFIVEEELKNLKDDKVFYPFYFISISRQVVDIGIRAKSMEDFVKGIELSSINSIFYHMVSTKIDNRKAMNDYSEWLLSKSFSEKAEKILGIDLYTSNLIDVKNKILEILKQ